MHRKQNEQSNLIVCTVSHPGEEVMGRSICVSTGIMDWGTAKHGRKFLKCAGKYVTLKGNKFKLGSETNQSLMFWGEWEAPSRCTPVCESDAKTEECLPKNIHEPLLILPPPMGAMNTDPYVFGDVFYYSNCQQRGRRLDLPDQSMIIFGTGIGRGMEFMVDTVFVVGSSQPYTVGDTSSLKVSKSFKETVLKRLAENTTCGAQTNYTLYSGKMFSEEDNDFFSFVPCNLEGHVLSRPIIDFGSQKYSKLLYRIKKDLKNLRYSAFLVEAGDEKRIREFWAQLVSDITKDGQYLLGTSFVEPQIQGGEYSTHQEGQSNPHRCGTRKPVTSTI